MPSNLRAVVEEKVQNQNNQNQFLHAWHQLWGTTVVLRISTMVSSSGSNDAMRLSRDVRQRSAREPKNSPQHEPLALVEKDVEDLGPSIVVQAINMAIYLGSHMTLMMYAVCLYRSVWQAYSIVLFSYSSRYLWRKPGALPVRPRLPPAIQELAAAARPSRVWHVLVVHGGTDTDVPCTSTCR